MEISRALAVDSNDVSHLRISHKSTLRSSKVSGGGWWGRVIIVSALSLSLRDKESLTIKGGNQSKDLRD